MTGTTEVAVKGADLPSKLTSDPFGRHGPSSACTQSPLSTGDGQQLGPNSSSDRAILSMDSWCSPASFLKLPSEIWEHFAKTMRITAKHPRRTLFCRSYRN